MSDPKTEEIDPKGSSEGPEKEEEKFFTDDELTKILDEYEDPEKSSNKIKEIKKDEEEEKILNDDELTKLLKNSVEEKILDDDELTKLLKDEEEEKILTGDSTKNIEKSPKEEEKTVGEKMIDDILRTTLTKRREKKEEEKSDIEKTVGDILRTSSDEDIEELKTPHSETDLTQTQERNISNMKKSGTIQEVVDGKAFQTKTSPPFTQGELVFHNNKWITPNQARRMNVGVREIKEREPQTKSADKDKEFNIKLLRGLANSNGTTVKEAKEKLKLLDPNFKARQQFLETNQLLKTISREDNKKVNMNPVNKPNMNLRIRTDTKTKFGEKTTSKTKKIIKNIQLSLLYGTISKKEAKEMVNNFINTDEIKKADYTKLFKFIDSIIL